MLGAAVSGDLASTVVPAAFPEDLPDPRTGDGLLTGFAGAAGAIFVVVVRPGWGRGPPVGAVLGRSPDTRSGVGL
jgi:hypothetical protein